MYFRSSWQCVFGGTSTGSLCITKMLNNLSTISQGTVVKDMYKIFLYNLYSQLYIDLLSTLFFIQYFNHFCTFYFQLCQNDFICCKIDQVKTLLPGNKAGAELYSDVTKPNHTLYQHTHTHKTHT